MNIDAAPTNQKMSGISASGIFLKIEKTIKSMIVANSPK